MAWLYGETKMSEQQKQWYAIKESTLAAINEIDLATPCYGDNPPTWWMEMSSVRRQLMGPLE